MKKVSTDVLPNGLRWYGQYDSARSGYVCGVGVRVGSAYDPHTKIGAAHLAEHVSFLQSKKYSPEDVYRKIHYIGGLDEINVRVDNTSTFFGSPLMYAEKDARDLLDMIADVVKHGSFDTAGVASEKSAIHQEYFLTDADIPESLLYVKFLQTLNPKNPAFRPVVGDMNHIEAMTPQDVRSFVRRYYVPKNMFAIILGPRMSDVATIANEHFGDWGATTKPAPDISAPPFSPLTRMRSHEEKRIGIHQYHVMIGYPTEHHMTRDAEALDVLNQVLQFRLIMRLRAANADFNKGVYRVRAYTDRTWLYGAFYIAFATSDQEYALLCERIIQDEIRRLREDLISEADFTGFSRAVMMNPLNAFKSVPQELTELIVSATCNGDEDLAYLHNFKERMSRLTRRKIRAAAQKYFTKHYARTIIAPA